MGSRLDAGQFAAYARDRIRDAVAILDAHQPDRYGLCACGRPRPCSVVETCQHSIAHYRSKLAVIEATQPLPIVTPATRTPGEDHDHRRRHALNPAYGTNR